MRRMTTIAILAMLAGACSTGKEHGTQKTLTEAQRDSVLSRSDLPGASVVGRAMTASSREQRHASELNAMTDTLPH